jgi:hypothetical protein
MTTTIPATVKGIQAYGFARDNLEGVKVELRTDPGYATFVLPLGFAVPALGQNVRVEITYLEEEE